MSKFKLPAFLNLPPKLLCLLDDEVFNKYKYFVIEGGRGSGKSQSVVRVLSYLASIRNIRVMCGREFQTNIKESVHALFSDIIEEFRLRFNVLNTEIRHNKSKSRINFRGFRDQGKINIKGMEGIDAIFIDEGQTLTKPVIDILIPTIRKEKAKVFIAMNRYLEDDPIFVEIVGRPDCLHIHIDYFENPHCPETLKKEAAICKARNIEEYNHIWLGQPLKQANTAAFRDVMAIVDEDLPVKIDPMPGFHYSLGADLAKSVDHSSISILCIELKQLHYFEEMESENKASWNYQKMTITALASKYNNALVTTDSTGVGDPITEDLQRAGCNVFVETVGDTNPKQTAGFKFTGTSKPNLVEKLKVAIELQLFRIPHIVKLVKQLIQYEALKLPSGKTKYGCPAGIDPEGNDIYHDDNVMSLALALWGTRSMIYDKEYVDPKPETKEDAFWKKVNIDKIRRKRNNPLQDAVNHGIDNVSFIDEGIPIPDG